MKLLLDTHVLLWWSADARRLSSTQRRALARVAHDRPALVSDISLWEIATLEELGRIRLQLPLLEWLERATAAPLVQRCGISPLVAATVAKLPATFQRDPADRILVATALALQATLVTSDERILDAGLVPTLS